MSDVSNQGVVHGDLHPLNMLWDELGQRVMLIDFEGAVYRARKQSWEALCVCVSVCVCLCVCVRERESTFLFALGVYTDFLFYYSPSLFECTRFYHSQSFIALAIAAESE
jgi:serine/threonine protein kinase